MTQRIISRWLLLCAFGVGWAAVSPVYGQYVYSLVEQSGGTVFSSSVLDVSLYDYADGAYVYAALSDPNGNGLDWGDDEEFSWNDYDAYAEVDLEGQVNLTGYFSVYADNYEWYLPIEDWLYLGPTSAGTSVYSGGGGPPVISNISPSSGTYGEGDGWGASGGYIQIYGSNLDPDGATCLPWVSFGSCYWASDDGTQVNLYYDGSAPPGTYPIEIETDGGMYSNQTTFTINGDPTPSISSISPSTWQAGTTVPFTISGSGFGTNPTAQYSCCSDGVSYSTLSDSEIDGTITVDPNSPTGTLTIMITSNGYNGYSFQGGQQGQSNQATAQVQVQAAPPPVPRIFWNGQDITNPPPAGQAQPSVMVGQQVSLSGGNNGGTGANPTWTIGVGVASQPYVGGFNPTGANNGLVTNVNTDSQNVAFYFATSGMQTVSYSLTAPGGGVYTGAATFNVQLPGNVGFNVEALGAAGIVVDAACDPNGVQLAVHYGGCPTHTAGMSFFSNPSNNGDGWEWIQVVPSVTVTADGVVKTPPTCSNGYDTSLPYETANDAKDSPLVPLSSSASVYGVNMSFKMFLLYNPSNSGIFVPLYEVDWGWSVTVSATNGGNGWSLASPAASSNPIVLPALPQSYPSWSAQCGG